jgi:glycyl-tRNA synthetase beta chain
VHFVRPAHGLVALHGAEVVPVHGAGPEAGPHDARPPLRGAHGPPVVLRRRRQLRRQLRDEGAVIASFESAAPRSLRQLHAAPRPASA